MTPRLDPIELTQEDRDIWVRVFLKAGALPEWSRGRFQRHDRRDAYLMWWWVECPKDSPRAWYVREEVSR